MKALVKERPERGIVHRDVPDPAAAQNEVIVQVKACGISGSEVARYLWTEAYHAGHPKDMSRDLPRIMGHEFSGTVAALGKGVHSTSVGERVVVQSVIGCGSCEFCDAGFPNLCDRRQTIGVNRDGGFAQFAVMPARNVYHVPDDVSLEMLALLQPFSIATYAVEISGVSPGQRVGVWGVGAIGMSIILNAQLAGASVVFAVGRNEKRLEQIHNLGVEHVVSANREDAMSLLHHTFDGNKVDVVFEASGAQAAVCSSLSILRKCGRVVIVGNIKEPVTLDLLSMVMDQKQIVTVRTYSLTAWRRALSLIGRVQEHYKLLRTQRIPLSDGERAFEQAASDGGIKFIVEP